jgi:hypothetical protein
VFVALRGTLKAVHVRHTGDLSGATDTTKRRVDERVTNTAQCGTRWQNAEINYFKQ